MKAINVQELGVRYRPLFGSHLAHQQLPASIVCGSETTVRFGSKADAGLRFYPMVSIRWDVATTKACNMYLLSKEGSRHLLEFLRNLIPQVLLLSSALLLFVFWKRIHDVYPYLVVFAGISVMCIVASIANINNFMDNAFSQSAAIATERDRLKSESIDGYVRIRRILRFIWKKSGEPWLPCSSSMAPSPPFSSHR